MILLDANLPLHAYDRSSPRHDMARNWFGAALNGPEPVRFSWVTILAFLRISTNTRAFARPMAISDALTIVDRWLDLPLTGILEPTARHLEILRTIAVAGQARGPLLTDAHLATLAIEHGATLCTTDRDFDRFPGLSFRNPLAD